jgi:hypothetical protein
MSFTRDTWPIAAGLLQFPGVRRDGVRVQDASPGLWFDDLAEVASAGFRDAEVADGWLRVADVRPGSDCPRSPCNAPASSTPCTPPPTWRTATA